jgi:O-antigen ligase/polysaccharide polymerase Wzy-like membrane protein
LLRTYSASALSIAAVCIILLTLSRSGFHFARAFVSLPLEGFSANRNAFSFQLLLAVCAIFAGRWRNSEVWLGLIFGGLLLSGSRAVFLGLFVVAAIALYLQLTSARKMIVATVIAIALFAVVDYSPNVITYLSSTTLGKPAVWVDHITLGAVLSNSDNFRIESLVGGWSLFSSHPVFGAGLGAFMHQQSQAGDALVIHSTPLWLLAEVGVIGFVILAMPLVRIFWIEITKIENRDVAGMFLLMIIAAFGVVSNAHEILYQRAFWLLLGGALALVPRKHAAAHRD